MNYKLLLEKSPICFAQVDTDQGILYANPAFCTFTGYSCNELKSKSFSEITHPEDIKKDVLEFERMLKGEVNEYRLQKRYIQKSGKIVWGDLFVSLIPGDLYSSHFSIFASVIDITERKTFEIAILKNRDSIRQAQVIAKMGSWEYDPIHGVGFWSKNLFQTFKSRSYSSPIFHLNFSKVLFILMICIALMITMIGYSD